MASNVGDSWISGNTPPIRRLLRIKMRFRLLAALAALLTAGPSTAYDVKQAPHYASPDMYRPNVDRIIVNGAGSTGDVSTMNVTPSAGAATKTLARLIADRATLAGPNTFSLPAPDWNNYRTPFTPFIATIGSAYPAAAMAGGNTVGTAHAITGAVTIPETTRNNTQALFATGVAGYARSLNSMSPNQGAVGLYGAGFCAVTGSSCWGSNIIVTNIPDLSEPQVNRGSNNVNMWGLELDFNVQKTTARADPGGNLRGVDLTGNSNARPRGEFVAVSIKSPGIYHNFSGFGSDGALQYENDGPLRWKESMSFGTGSTDRIMTVNPNRVTGAAGTPPLVFISRKPDGSLVTAALQTDPYGNVLLTPGMGANAAFTKSDQSTAFSAGDAGVFINVDGTAKSVTVGSLDSCGTGYKCLRVPN